MAGRGDRRSQSFASIQYHYPNLRFDGSTHASSSQKVCLSMWENLTSRFEGICFHLLSHWWLTHLGRNEKEWCQNPLSRPSCHLREDVSRGKQLAEWKPVKYEIFTWMFEGNNPGACFHWYLDISRVFFMTHSDPRCGLCAVVQPSTHSKLPGTRHCFGPESHGFPFTWLDAVYTGYASWIHDCRPLVYFN